MTTERTLVSVFRDEVSPTDLVVCLSARRDDMGWHSELQTFPKSISTLTDGSSLVVYPASDERADNCQFLRFS